MDNLNDRDLERYRRTLHARLDHLRAEIRDGTKRQSSERYADLAGEIGVPLR